VTPENPVVAASALRIPAITSPGFNLQNPDASPTPSWAILSSGLAYFFGLVLQGGGISGGTFIINNAGIFIYSGTPAGGNLIGSWTGAAGDDDFGNPYPEGLSVTVGTIDGAMITGGAIMGTTITGASINGATITGGTVDAGILTITSGAGLTVDGPLVTGGTITSGGPITSNGDLTVNGDLTTGPVTVLGVLTANDTNLVDLTVSSNQTVDGNITVHGAANVQGLTASGDISCADLTATGSETVQGHLNANGGLYNNGHLMSGWTNATAPGGVPGSYTTTWADSVNAAINQIISVLGAGGAGIA
jgi:hypothetical protein